MLQASSKRSLQCASRRLATNSTPPNALRCVCAFSSSCKSSQHQQPAEGPAGQANVGAYDRLFAGLNPSSPPRGGASSSAPPQRKIVSSYGPSFSYPPQDSSTSSKIGRPRRAGRVSPTKQRLNPADVEMFRNSMDALFPSLREERTLDDEKTADGDREELETRHKFQWADLLDKVTKKQEMQRGQEQTDVEVPSRHPVSSKMETALQEHHEEAVGRDLRARKLSETLKEEVKDLSTAVEALNWMHSRIFSPNKPDALIHKVTDPSVSTDSEHHALYPYLLTDLSKFLRSVAPHAALLPLKLASSLSPASYLHGCTPSLYASTMKTRWEVWGDIEGCHELLMEMDRGAVNLDSRIFGLVEDMQEAVYRDRRKAERHVHEEQKAVGQPRTESGQGAADAASATTVTTEEPFSPFAASDRVIHIRNRTSTSASSESNRAQEKAYERLVESKTFFSPAQRRSLRDMERIVIEYRKRYSEHQQREDRLEDAIHARSKAGDSTDVGEGSSVNALVDSYGKLERPSQEAMGESLPRHRLAAEHEAAALERPKFTREMRQGGSREGLAAIRDAASDDKAGAARPEDDILNQAISEMADKPVRISTSSRSRSGSKGRRARSKK